MTQRKDHHYASTFYPTGLTRENMGREPAT